MNVHITSFLSLDWRKLEQIRGHEISGFLNSISLSHVHSGTSPEKGGVDFIGQKQSLNDQWVYIDGMWKRGAFTVAHLLQLWSQLQFSGIRPSAWNTFSPLLPKPEIPEQSLPELPGALSLPGSDIPRTYNTACPEAGLLGFQVSVVIAPSK